MFVESKPVLSNLETFCPKGKPPKCFTFQTALFFFPPREDLSANCRHIFHSLARNHVTQEPACGQKDLDVDTAVKRLGESKGSLFPKDGTCSHLLRKGPWIFLEPLPHRASQGLDYAEGQALSKA